MTVCALKIENNKGLKYLIIKIIITEERMKTVIYRQLVSIKEIINVSEEKYCIRMTKIRMKSN